MRFMFIYHGGNVPPDQVEKNIEQLWNWIAQLKERGIEIAGFAGQGRQTVTRDGVSAYTGGVFGVSIIEAASLDEAAALTEDWPELPYGGKIDILQALD